MNDHPDPEVWWRWRRRLALWSFFVAIAQTIYLLGVGVPADAGPVISWSYALWGTVITAYIGASTWADVSKK